MRPFLFTIALAISATALAADMPATARHMQHATDEATALLNGLRSGGFVLYVRHERTNMLIQDDPEFVLGDCTTQRNLSVSGVASARDVAENFRRLNVPVGNVMASPMCRTLETARYVFGKATPEPRLLGARRGALAADLEAVLRSVSEDGTNGAVVAHISNFQALFGRRLQEGDTAVIDVTPSGVELKGVIPSAAWNDLLVDSMYAMGNRRSDDAQ